MTAKMCNGKRWNVQRQRCKDCRQRRFKMNLLSHYPELHECVKLKLNRCHFLKIFLETFYFSRLCISKCWEEQCVLSRAELKLAGVTFWSFFSLTCLLFTSPLCIIQSCMSVLSWNSPVSLFEAGWKIAPPAFFLAAPARQSKKEKNKNS